MKTRSGKPAAAVAVPRRRPACRGPAPRPFVLGPSCWGPYVASPASQAVGQRPRAAESTLWVSRCPRVAGCRCASPRRRSRAAGVRVVGPAMRVPCRRSSCGRSSRRRSRAVGGPCCAPCCLIGGEGAEPVGEQRGRWCGRRRVIRTGGALPSAFGDGVGAGGWRCSSVMVQRPVLADPLGSRFGDAVPVCCRHVAKEENRERFEGRSLDGR